MDGARFVAQKRRRASRRKADFESIRPVAETSQAGMRRHLAPQQKAARLDRTAL